VAVLADVSRTRRSFVDRALASVPLPISANDVTRLGAWACFLSAIALLTAHTLLAATLLGVGLAFDGLDGVAARRQGVACPEVDWAADRFTEALFIGALFWTQPWLVGLVYTSAYVANVFLPRGRVPVLALRVLLLGYLIATVILSALD